MDTPVFADHIESRPGVCGGKPCIRGTRIRVYDIHVWHDLRGLSPEEIVVTYPQLSVADVHAALAYYLDNRAAIEAQMEAARARVAQFEQAQGPTRFSQLRDELLQGKRAERTAISS